MGTKPIQALQAQLPHRFLDYLHLIVAIKSHYLGTLSWHTPSSTFVWGTSGRPKCCRAVGQWMPNTIPTSTWPTPFPLWPPVGDGWLLLWNSHVASTNSRAKPSQHPKLPTSTTPNLKQATLDIYILTSSKTHAIVLSCVPSCKQCRLTLNCFP